MTRHFLFALYDHLGQAVLLNLLWCVASVPWLATGAAVAWSAAAVAAGFGVPRLSGLGVVAALGLVALSPPSLWLCLATRAWLRPGTDGLRQAWAGARRLAWRAQAGGLLATAAIVALLGNALFYQVHAGWLGLALGGVMLWAAVGVVLAAFLLFPLLAERPDLSLRAATRQVALLVLDNPGRILAAGLAAGLCLLAAVASGVGLALGGLTATALVANLGLASLMPRYGGAPLEPEARTLRDLLRPWQA